MSTIGANIRAARLRAGFERAKDFAAAVGESPSRVSDWERDRFDTLELPTLLKIAKAARCSIDDLLTGIDPDYDAAARRDLTRPSGDTESGTSTSGGSPTDEQRAEVPASLHADIEALRRAIAAVDTAAEGIALAFRAPAQEDGRVAPPKPRRRRARRASG